MSFKDGQQAEYDALLKAEKEQVALLEEEMQVGGGEEGMLRVVGVVMWARQSQVYRKPLAVCVCVCTYVCVMLCITEVRTTPVRLSVTSCSCFSVW